MPLIRITTFELDDVLPYIVNEEGVYRQYGDYSMRMNSIRLFTFKTKGVECVTCGIKGQFLAQEYSTGSKLTIPHFNMYAIKDDGLELLMTVDHIIPKCKGGPRTIDNLNPMCTTCNCRKGAGESEPIQDYYHAEAKWQNHKRMCEFCRTDVGYCNRGKRWLDKADAAYIACNGVLDELPRAKKK